jgi:Uma2 family endonuclease
MNATTLPTTISSGNLRLASSPTQHADPYADSEGSFEVIQGKRVEKQMGLIENLIASLLHGRMEPFCREHRLGRAVTNTMFAIPGSGNDRKPDVAYVSYQTWAANRQIPRVNAWVVVPDLAVEVISPTDKAFDVTDKVQEYFAGGVRQVWQIFSNVEQVLIFDSPSSVRILTRADELIGDPVVPGFRMQLVDLFSLAEPTP